MAINPTHSVMHGVAIKKERHAGGDNGYQRRCTGGR